MPYLTDQLSNPIKGAFVKFLGLALIIMSANSLALESRYPQSLLDRSQASLCHGEDDPKAVGLAQDMHTFVVKKYEVEAKAAKLSVDDYLNRKETHDKFLTDLQALSSTKIEDLPQPEFILLSLEIGLQFQMLSQVRFPSLAMINQAGELLQNKWLPHLEQVTASPQGCDSAPQVNSTDRSNSGDKSRPSSASPSPASGAVSR